MVSFHEIDPEWWTCKRKKRFESAPDPMPKGMRSYGCQYCLGIHLTTERVYGRWQDEITAKSLASPR